MEEFIWNELHYALDDGLSRFSIISTFPRLPYEYDSHVLDIWRNDFLRPTGTCNQGEIIIYFHSREELYEVYLYLLRRDWNDLYVSDLSGTRRNSYTKGLSKRRWYDIEDVKQKKVGAPESAYSEINWSNGYNYESDFYASGFPPGVSTFLRVKVNFKNIEKFIQDIKDLKSLGYKNIWLYPGKNQLVDIQDYVV